MVEAVTPRLFILPSLGGSHFLIFFLSAVAPHPLQATQTPEAASEGARQDTPDAPLAPGALLECLLWGVGTRWILKCSPRP